MVVIAICKINIVGKNTNILRDYFWLSLANWKNLK